MIKIETSSNNMYPIFYTHLGRLSEMAELSFPTKFFTLLLAADFTKKRPNQCRTWQNP